ncbi:hypothetical protein [Streptomyces sp. NPDC006415]|uniref:hypothetical protein n=1 Tax=Streptomyces sp. NPDC006415 TaxID=3155351 RepID=UPI0033AB1F7D
MGADAPAPQGRPHQLTQEGRRGPCLARTLLAGAPTTGEHRAEGETYAGLATGLVVEVLAGTGRHGTLSVVRAR